MPIAYIDYGPVRHEAGPHKGLTRTRYADRPLCDLCGAFRGRFLRKVGPPDEYGQEYRCRGCDEAA